MARRSDLSIRELVGIPEEEAKPIEGKASELLRAWKENRIRDSGEFFKELWDFAKEIHTPAAYFVAGMYSEMLNAEVIREQDQKELLEKLGPKLKPRGKWYK